MTEQLGLFDAEPFRVEVRKPRIVIPATRVEWRRTALRRDCEGCWEQQKKEWKEGRFSKTRKAASWHLRVWDDDGNLSKEGFYCDDHARTLGCDTSRVKSSEKRKQAAEVERFAKAKLANEFTSLVSQARRRKITAAWCDQMRSVLGRAGGAGLDMPHWHLTDSGRLEGVFTTNAAAEVRAWAEVFGADVEREPVIGQTRYTADCRVITSPAVTVTVCGYVDRPIA